MNLIIDIGNTCAKLAVFKNEEILTFAQTSNQELTALPQLLEQYPIRQAILASVIRLSDTVENQLGRLPFKLLRLDSQTSVPIQNRYRTPQTLGADRLAAVIGAQAVKPHHDLLVIDAGTALTYDFIDREGNYHGGNIAPGLSMRFKALHQFTDSLPLIDTQGPVPETGYDTETAIRAGVVQGMRLEIEGYIALLRKKYPHLLVFLTGGDEFSFDTNLKSIIFADRFLVLKGLNRILKYNDHL